MLIIDKYVQALNIQTKHYQWDTVNNSTYTLLLPLEFGICHHALHALLHAPPL